MAKQDTKKDEKKPTATPKVKAQKVKPVTLDASKRYKFESNGTAKTMPNKGKIYVVGGGVAEILVNKGFGKIVE